MKYFSLALMVIVVTGVKGGIRDLNAQEEQDALQLYLRVCGQNQGTSGTRNIDGVNIHCKVSGQQPVQELLSHQVSVPGNPNQQSDIVFVQPPPVSYQHSIQLNGQSGQAGQTRIYVLPQRANHQISTNFNIGQITRSKPVVHFLNRNGQNNINTIQTTSTNTIANVNNLNNVNPVQTTNAVRNLQNQIQTSNVLQNGNNVVSNNNVIPNNNVIQNTNFRQNPAQFTQGTQTQTISNLLNNVRTTATTPINQFGLQNQGNPLQQPFISQNQQFPNNIRATPTPFVNSQQQQQVNTFTVQNADGTFTQTNANNNNNQLPIQIRNSQGQIVNQPVIQGQILNQPVVPAPAPLPVPIRAVPNNAVPAPIVTQTQVLPKQHVQAVPHQQIVSNQIQIEPSIARHLQPLIPQGAVLEQQKVHVQEISAQPTHHLVQKQHPVQAHTIQKQEGVQWQELPVQIVHKQGLQQPHPHPHHHQHPHQQVQLIEKHPGHPVQQVPIQLVQKQHHHPQGQLQEIPVHPTQQVGFHGHGGQPPIHFQHHQAYGPTGLNPFELGDPQGFPLGEDLPIFGPGYAKA